MIPDPSCRRVPGVVSAAAGWIDHRGMCAQLAGEPTTDGLTRCGRTEDVHTRVVYLDSGPCVVVRLGRYATGYQGGYLESFSGDWLGAQG